MDDPRLRIGVALTHPPLDAPALVATARRAEVLGFDSIWSAEAYGHDAVVPITWMAAHTARIRLGTAIMQIPARTPAATAMTAMTLDLLSGGRFHLGLGLSGPQVAEGWHGQSASAPLARSRDYVAIVRQVLEGSGPIEHHGRVYDVPLSGEGSTGVQPMRGLLAARPGIPLYLAAIGPKNMRMAMTIGEGLIPVFFSPEHWPEVHQELLADQPDGFDIAPLVRVLLEDEHEDARGMVAAELALYIGGMGSARTGNYYNDLARRYGFEEAADEIRDRYQAGDRRGAADAVPDALLDAVSIVGSAEQIADRLEIWRCSPATTLLLQDPTIAVMEVVAHHRR